MMADSECPEAESPSRPESAVGVKERPQPIVHTDPEIMGGTPVFVGTRVPLDAMFDYLEGGHSLNEFLDDFPTVDREQALSSLEIARGAVLKASAHPHR